MIDSVLIANRGEIALRVIGTCRRLGIRTIGVYSDADASARHVTEADEAQRIGPPAAAESYLNAGSILEAARRSGAQAIHPGYGFLAENADFAQAVSEAGLVWIGPPPAAMRIIGDKARARELAQQQGVPVLTGYHGVEQSPEHLTAEAERIGFPVLIKASAGGGGRGMRVVDSAADFERALESARREAHAAFGDDRVLLERYVARPRHVEVQIIGDQHGNMIHLGERECSIQRRHQKLIEESPSPAIDAEMRARLGDASLRLARAAGYANAGTVEFLLDERGGFAFLEVNARLQVEHPVTEAVTGLDLVQLQLRVAAGEPLPLGQEDVRLDGHAIEVRVIAEDPLTGFLPSSGRIERVEFPSFVRVDTWIVDGTTVSPYYDSLLAKLIAHDSTRAAAARRLADGLQQVRIDGVADNVDLLLATLEHPAFLRGDLDTGFLDQHGMIDDLRAAPAQVVAGAAALDSLTATHADDPWRETTAWRLGRVDQPAAWLRAGCLHEARVSAVLGGGGVNVVVGRDSVYAQALGSAPPTLSRRRVNVDGEMLTVWDHDDRRIVEWRGRSYRLSRPRPLSVDATRLQRGSDSGRGELTAPMPSRVVRVVVGAGERVRQNQPLIVLEAMKMEHVVEAPHDGIVSDIVVAAGDQVPGGARLLTLGPADDHATRDEIRSLD